MKIQQMRHLVAAADSSSFAQAAKKCFTSRQNVVHSIREIEKELGTTLFDRENNELSLTPSGQQVVSQAWIILREVDRLEVMFSEQNGKNSSITLAVSSNFISGIPSGAQVYLTEHASRLRFLEMGAEECYNAVCAGKVDAALILSMSRSFSNCSAIKIANEPAYAVVSPRSPLAKRSSVTAIDLKNYRLSVISEPPFQYMPLFSELDSLRYNRDDINVITTESWMRYMVDELDSVGIVSEGFARTMNADGAPVAAIPIADHKLNWNFYALYERNVANFRAVIKVINDFKAAFETGEEEEDERFEMRAQPASRKQVAGGARAASKAKQRRKADAKKA